MEGEAILVEKTTPWQQMAKRESGLSAKDLDNYEWKRTSPAGPVFLVAFAAVVIYGSLLWMGAI